MKNILKHIKATYIIAFIFFLTLFTYTLITTYSADDYQYSLFLDNGIFGWIQNMINHYHIRNGRTFVHLIATAILHFNNLVFAVVFSVSIFSIALCLKSKSIKNDCFWFFFLGGFLLTPRPIMVEGVLWISGFCNYVFPTAVAALLFYHSNQELNKNIHNKKNIFFLMTLSFFAGATTEQTGIAVCILLVLMFIESVSTHNKAYTKICFFEIIFACLGVISILLSPATQERVDIETNMSIFQCIDTSLLTQRTLLLNSPMLIVLMVVFPILLLMDFYKKKGMTAISVISALIEICIIFIINTENVLSAHFYCLLLLLLLLLSVICWFSDKRKQGCLLCYAVSTSVVMLITQSSAYRTLLPMYIVLLSLVCNLFCQMISVLAVKHINAVRCIVIMFISVVFGTVVYDMPHYIYNHKIDMINNKNMSQAQYSKTLYYCMDYDESYTHTKAYNDGHFYSTFLETLRLPSPLQNIYFYGENLPAVFVNNKRGTFPGILDKSGELFLPLREIVEELGGTVSWQGYNGTEIILNNKVCYLFNTNEGFEVSWQDDNIVHHEKIPVSLTQNYCFTTLPVSFFKDRMGLEVKLYDSCVYIK